ncbi:MAG TPA: class I SAM-dependent methyltransferase [Candidatus Obscuribacterales bacterium]
MGRLRAKALQLAERSFSFWQSLGLHVVPNHFYQPIPDTRFLDNRLWQKESELVGIDMREKQQLELLERFAKRYRSEYEALPRQPNGVPYQFYFGNGAFETVDAEMLYCFVRDAKPARMIEIGSGCSTYLAAQAVRKNAEEGKNCRLIAIEPYPNPTLQAGFPGLTSLIESPVQNIAMQEFESLTANDILFIDSSHVLKIGSDVQYEFLEILPRLKPGVLIHIHDIFLPKEYPRDWVIKHHRFWSEQYLLQAFLMFNGAFEVVWAGSYMHLRNPEKLEQYVPSYSRNTSWPGSFWIRRMA